MPRVRWPSATPSTPWNMTRMTCPARTVGIGAWHERGAVPGVTVPSSQQRAIAVVAAAADAGPPTRTWPRARRIAAGSRSASGGSCRSGIRGRLRRRRSAPWRIPSWRKGGFPRRPRGEPWLPRRAGRSLVSIPRAKATRPQSNNPSSPTRGRADGAEPHPLEPQRLRHGAPPTPWAVAARRATYSSVAPVATKNASSSEPFVWRARAVPGRPGGDLTHPGVSTPVSIAAPSPSPGPSTVGTASTTVG